MTLQRSALHPLAAAAGVSFVEHHGWELPGAYADPLPEYQAMVEGVGVYDASHMGRLRATGDDTLDLLHRLSTNSVVSLEPGQGTTTVLTTDRGRILDVVVVAHADDHVLLLTSPGTAEAVVQFLDKYTIMEDLEVEDVSSATAMLALWGPGARAILEAASGAPPQDLPPYHTATLEVLGRRVRAVACEMPDIPGYYLIVPADEAEALWRGLTEAGATPVGEEAYELARIGSGAPVHGHEMGEEYNPLEAGLIGSIDFTKGCYIGQEVIARLDSYHKVQKYLVRVAFGPDADVSPGAILSHEGKAVGKVTSAAKAPGAGEALGLAYVRTPQATPGTVLELEPPAAGTARVEGLSQVFGPGQG